MARTCPQTARTPSAKRSGWWIRPHCRRTFVADDAGETPCALVVMGVSGSGEGIIGHGRNDVRIVYLKGTQDLIASRLALRKDHFMPPGLLASQFGTLEPPDASENPVTVSIDGSVETIVDDIVRQLRLSPADSGAFSRNRS